MIIGKQHNSVLFEVCPNSHFSTKQPHLTSNFLQGQIDILKISSLGHLSLSCTVGAVFKSAGSIVLKSFLMRVLLQRGFYWSEDSIAQSLGNEFGYYVQRSLYILTNKSNQKVIKQIGWLMYANK